MALQSRGSGRAYALPVVKETRRRYGAGLELPASQCGAANQRQNASHASVEDSGTMTVWIATNVTSVIGYANRRRSPIRQSTRIATASAISAVTNDRWIPRYGSAAGPIS